MNERKNSKVLFEQAKQLIPGGVSSPVRAFQPYPCYIRSGKGSRITDVDDNEYIDYCMAYGPLILGHANPKVVAAIKSQADLGTLYGAPIEMEVEYARLINHHFPSMGMISALKRPSRVACVAFWWDRRAKRLPHFKGPRGAISYRRCTSTTSLRPARIPWKSTATPSINGRARTRTWTIN